MAWQDPSEASAYWTGFGAVPPPPSARGSSAVKVWVPVCISTSVTPVSVPLALNRTWAAAGSLATAVRVASMTVLSVIAASWIHLKGFFVIVARAAGLLVWTSEAMGRHLSGRYMLAKVIPRPPRWKRRGPLPHRRPRPHEPWEQKSLPREDPSPVPFVSDLPFTRM